MIAYLTWAGLLALLALLTLWLYRRPPRVEVARELPESVFVGGGVTVRLRIRVRAALPTRLLLEDPPPLTLVPDRAVEFGGLLWREAEHELSARLTANRRGVYEWEGVRLRWADPFGLRWRSVTLPARSKLEVYPGAHGLMLPKLLRPLLSEGALSRALGLEDPISLRGARPYVSGDPTSRVAWKLSARAGELMVREVERTASSSLHIHLDLEGDGEYVESAVRLAASLLTEAAELNLPVSVSTREGATPLGTTPETLRFALRVLAQARRDAGAPFIPTPKPGSNLIVITQQAGDALVDAALMARAGASRVCIVALPEGFYLEPGEKGRRLHAAPPDQVRELSRRAGILAESGVLVFVLRGNQSILRLGG